MVESESRKKGLASAEAEDWPVAEPWCLGLKSGTRCRVLGVCMCLCV